MPLYIRHKACKEHKMYNATLVLQGMSIVLLGDFNPKIFQPAWFVAHGLIGEKEAEIADIQIINSDVIFYTMDWLRVQVTRERFQIDTAQEPYYEVLRDLVKGTFTLLAHTPIHSMGINLDYHYRMGSEKEWHDFGDFLAPKSAWASIMNRPGLRNIVMESSRTDKYAGLIRIAVAPSTKVNPGIYFSVNDHYEISDKKKAIGCDEIMNIFNDAWDKSLNFAKTVPNNLMVTK